MTFIENLPPLLLLIFGLFIGVLLGALIMWIRHCLSLRDAIATASHRSVQISRSTLKGQIAEQMAPLLQGFTYLPSDARFLGDPIDYVVFNRYTSVKDDAGSADDVEIVILDIKHGKAKLSQSQRAIAEAVEAGRVRFEVVRIAEDGKVSVHKVRPENSVA